jgi:transcriptional regulator with XRE-family HTH domain
MDHFGAVLKARRLAQNHTQRTLAEAAGVSFTYISKIEAGLALPGEALIHALAGILNVDAERWCVLAGRIDTEALELLAAHNADAACLLRALPTLPPQTLRALCTQITERSLTAS